MAKLVLEAYQKMLATRDPLEQGNARLWLSDLLKNTAKGLNHDEKANLAFAEEVARQAKTQNLDLFRTQHDDKLLLLKVSDAAQLLLSIRDAASQDVLVFVPAGREKVVAGVYVRHMNVDDLKLDIGVANPTLKYNSLESGHRVRAPEGGKVVYLPEAMDADDLEVPGIYMLTVRAWHDKVMGVKELYFLVLPQGEKQAS
jgi:hypothetical protein